MTIEVVLSHLTRMKGDRVCVAATDASGRSLRPVLRAQPTWNDSDLAPAGPIELGTVFSMSEELCGAPPHSEDVLVRREDLLPHGRMPYEGFLARLATGVSELTGCFGASHEIAPRTARLVVAPGAGQRSLGVIRTSAMDVYRRGDRLRAVVDHPTLGDVEMTVADLRLTPWTQRRDDMWALTETLRKHGALLTVGLTRPYGEPAWCWSQINGIFVEDPDLTGW